MTHNEAPERLYMCFAVGDKNADATYIRSDIAEARAKNAVGLVLTTINKIIATDPDTTPDGEVIDEIVRYLNNLLKDYK